MIYVWQLEWDLETVTASDYTLQIPLKSKIVKELSDYKKDNIAEPDSETGQKVSKGTRIHHTL